MVGLFMAVGSLFLPFQAQAGSGAQPSHNSRGSYPYEQLEKDMFDYWNLPKVDVRRNRVEFGNRISHKYPNKYPWVVVTYDSKLEKFVAKRRGGLKLSKKLAKKYADIASGYALAAEHRHQQGTNYKPPARPGLSKRGYRKYILPQNRK